MVMPGTAFLRNAIAYMILDIVVVFFESLLAVSAASGDCPTKVDWHKIRDCQIRP